MTTIKYGAEVEVNDDLIEDVIIDLAGYGMRYWAASAIVDEENRRYTIRWWDEARLVTDSDYNEPESLTITFDNIANALGRIVSAEPIPFLSDTTKTAVLTTLAEIHVGEENPGGDIDADVADQIIQVAAFGSVLFG